MGLCIDSTKTGTYIKVKTFSHPPRLPYIQQETKPMAGDQLPILSQYRILEYSSIFKVPSEVTWFLTSEGENYQQYISLFDL